MTESRSRSSVPGVVALVLVVVAVTAGLLAGFQCADRASVDERASPSADAREPGDGDGAARTSAPPSATERESQDGERATDVDVDADGRFGIVVRFHDWEGALQGPFAAPRSATVLVAPALPDPKVRSSVVPVEDGFARVRFDVPDGEYVIGVSAEGYTGTIVGVVVSEDEGASPLQMPNRNAFFAVEWRVRLHAPPLAVAYSVAGIDIELTRCAALRVRIQTVDGEPLEPVSATRMFMTYECGYQGALQCRYHERVSPNSNGLVPCAPGTPTRLGARSSSYSGFVGRVHFENENYWRDVAPVPAGETRDVVFVTDDVRIVYLRFLAPDGQIEVDARVQRVTNDRRISQVAMQGESRTWCIWMGPDELELSVSSRWGVQRFDVADSTREDPQIVKLVDGRVGQIRCEVSLPTGYELKGDERLEYAFVSFNDPSGTDLRIICTPMPIPADGVVWLPMVPGYQVEVEAKARYLTFEPDSAFGASIGETVEFTAYANATVELTLLDPSGSPLASPTGSLVVSWGLRPDPRAVPPCVAGGGFPIPADPEWPLTVVISPAPAVYRFVVAPTSSGDGPVCYGSATLFVPDLGPHALTIQLQTLPSTEPFEVFAPPGIPLADGLVVSGPMPTYQSGGTALWGQRDATERARYRAARTGERSYWWEDPVLFVSVFRLAGGRPSYPLIEKWVSLPAAPDDWFLVVPGYGVYPTRIDRDLHVLDAYVPDEYRVVRGRIRGFAPGTEYEVSVRTELSSSQPGVNSSASFNVALDPTTGEFSLPIPPGRYRIRCTGNVIDEASGNYFFAAGPEVTVDTAGTRAGETIEVVLEAPE